MKPFRVEWEIEDMPADAMPFTYSTDHPSRVTGVVAQLLIDPAVTTITINIDRKDES